MDALAAHLPAYAMKKDRLLNHYREQLQQVDVFWWHELDFQIGDGGHVCDGDNGDARIAPLSRS
jgi:hypothetical protein